MAGDGCSLNLSGLKSSECNTYKNWHDKKKDAYNLKLPANLDAPGIKIEKDHIHENFDIDEEEAIIHKLMISSLPEHKKFIYTELIIEKKALNCFISSNRKFLKEHKLCKSQVESILNEFKVSVKKYLYA
jgi:hypothetical protein